nr:glycerophosphodiester phosphodiesterase family protein [uncultured Celeribacter sp.]
MTKIVCHRGARLCAPENTFASADTALRQCGDILELDIRQSRDGVLYVMHDETVDRTTNGSGPIADMTSQEINALDAGSWFGAEFSGAPVPRLEAYLSAFKSRAGFYLEVKWADPDAVAALVRQLGITAQCFTFSFSAEMRAGIQQAIPELRRMILWAYAGSVEAAVEDHAAQIVEFHDSNLHPADVRACQMAGLTTQIFTDRWDPTRMQETLSLGLDHVNIDHVAEYAELRRRALTPA